MVTLIAISALTQTFNHQKIAMNKGYVEQREGGYWIANTRVSLDSVIFAFLEGLSPETIAAECFPVLTLEQVYGAIAYYLAHRAEINAYLQQADAEFAALQQSTHEADPAFYEKLMSRRQLQMMQA